MRESIEAYLLIAPSLFGFVAFLLLPIIGVFVLSLFSWDLIGDPHFVGLANYRTLAGDHGAWNALDNTLYYVLLNIPAQTVLALLLAIALNRKLRGGKVFRVLFVLPWMAMPVALGIVWTWVFDPRNGVVNHLLALVGVAGPNWLTDKGWAMPVIASVNVWQYTGYTMLFLLAGLQAIPQTIYEAAEVDGVTGVQRFFRITLPLLRPSMLFVLVTNVIGSFQVFDTVYVMTQGGPGDSTTTMNFYIYQQAFQLFHAGYASALSIVLFVLILLVTACQFLYFRKRTVYDFS
ncbi:carbohydrate ABC transporter permease [Streptacidiphilus carbonis]|uniref:carbohydrate ABC transporter permease n=1 Tax=Streptacidiphilus carbonis TaxID=105422 RepID=UPI0005A76240|nr:sugar ABC transporter permease [Streptacidiphilus carbonis]